MLSSAMTRSILLGGLLALFLVSSCRTSSSDSEIKWGHLNDPLLVPASPSYLINKTTRDSYNICLAKYMVDLYPGIDTEIQAAIHIWAFYLGRSIPVKITIKDLPRAKASDSPEALSTQYNSICGKGFDTVVGMSALTGGSVGVTSFSSEITRFADGTEKMTGYQRYLFLRDFTIAPDTIGTFSRWESYQQHFNRAFSKDQLVQIMKPRNQVIYSQNGKLLTLTTLAHEIGHIWGLCDQYEGPTNCSATNSSTHKVLDSVMGAASMREKIYLTDDDIDGVRALAARPGFQHDWAVTSALTAAPAAILKKPVELFRQIGLSQANGQLAVVFALVTNVPSRIVLQLKAKNESLWQDFSTQNSDPSGFNWTHMTSSVQLSNGETRKFDVKLLLQTNQNGAGFRDAGSLIMTQP